MRKKGFLSAGLAFLMAATALTARAGDLLDRIVATVNGAVILQSDWDDAARYEAFMAGSSPQQLSAAERKAALDRLIDQELLREQMQASDFPHATPEEVSERLQQVREQYPKAQTGSGWHDLLARWNLTEQGLKDRIALQMNLMRLVDLRLRPNISIDSKSIESYYSQELVPKLRQEGAKQVPLAEVSPKIKELLTQRKVSELLTAWLQNLRAGSEIHTMMSTQGDQMQ